MHIDELDREIYGMTYAEAIAQGICINCRRPPVLYSRLVAAEYKISALCDACFDEITKEEDDD